MKILNRTQIICIRKTEEKMTEKVLSIGNSFTRDANLYRKLINKYDPENSFEVTQADIGGCSLEKHLRLAKGNEADPENPEFRCYNNPEYIEPGIYGLKPMLLAYKWKYITIQQVSHESAYIDSFRPYAAELVAFIKKYRPESEIIIHETWADRVDNPRLIPQNLDQAEMYRRLNKAYATIAQELGGLRIIPVGDAFQILREKPGHLFVPEPDFDKDTCIFPELPDQTNALCIGWIWDKDAATGERKLIYDHHANAAGRLLAALVWRQFFFPHIDIRKNGFKPAGLSSEYAALIRDVAYDTVKNKRKPSIA